MKADGDAGSYGHVYGLRNGEIRFSSSANTLAPPNDRVAEAIEIYGSNAPAQGEAPLVQCTRDVTPSAAAPQDEFTCTGL